jgi:tyrosyl-tRNA synthetase
MARSIQQAYGQQPQIVLTMPLLAGTDGVQKMSKSLRNQIGVTEPPEEIYGKTMRIPDEQLTPWYSLLLGEEPPAGLAPRDAKRALARRLVARFHGEAAAREAEAAFDRVFIAHEPPAEIEDAAVAAADGTIHMPAVIAEHFGRSRSEARRTLAQGGVRLDGEVVRDLDLPAAAIDGRVLQLGKRHFRRLRVT